MFVLTGYDVRNTWYCVVFFNKHSISH